MIIKKEDNSNCVTIASGNRTFQALLAITFLLPWPHGGEVNWQYLVFCIVIFGLTFMYFVKYINTPSNLFTQLEIITLPASLLIIWLLFQVLQTIPLPIQLTDVTFTTLPKDSWQTISVSPNITLMEIIKHASFVAIFILAFLLLNSKSRIIKLGKVLFFSSAIIALYSITNYITKGALDLIPSIPPWVISWEEATHGTFSYQNHYASFLTLTIPIGFGLLHIKVKNSNTAQRVDKVSLSNMFWFFFSIKGVYAVCLIIMTISLIKTGSRGGNSVFIFSITLTLFCILIQNNKPKKDKLKSALLVSTGAIVITTIIFFSGLTDTLVKRFDKQGYNSNSRILMSQTTFAIIEKRPIVGSGAGTFPFLQHYFKSPSLGVTPMSKRAHNEYLELLANQGILGFSLLGTATLLLLFILFRGLKRDTYTSSGSLYGFQVASFCSVIAILIHSLVDFNFHLPVNVVYFYIIVALGIKSQLINKAVLPN